MTWHVRRDEEARRHPALWLLYAAAVMVLLMAGGRLAVTALNAQPAAERQGASPAPSPSPTVGVVTGAAQTGSEGSSAATSTSPQAAGGNGNGSGGSSGGSPGHAITVTGVVQGQVAPGHQATLLVTITNPNSQDIVVTSVAGSVTSVTSAGQAGKPVCSASWYQVGAFNGTLPITKNGSGSVSLPVTFFDSPTINQDNCKDQHYTFTFTAQARQA